MQIADTAVKTACINSGDPSAVVAPGIISSAVPTAIAARYAAGMTRDGCPNQRVSHMA